MAIASIPKNPISDIGWQDEPNGTMSTLPRDVFYDILIYTCREPKDVVQVSLVCKLWRTAINSFHLLWKTIATSYPDITLNPDIHPKEQIQALFQKVKEMNYPEEIFKVFGGIKRIAQIPTVVLPRDYQKIPWEYGFKEEYQGQNPIIKFFGLYGPAFGIKYIYNVDKKSEYVNFPAGRYESILLLFNQGFPQQQWDFRDTWSSRTNWYSLYLERNNWLTSPKCVEWVQKLVSGSPCQKIYLRNGEIGETPVLNADDKPFYQLWSPMDDLLLV